MLLTSTRSATAASVAAFENFPKVAYSEIVVSSTFHHDVELLGNFAISVKLVLTVKSQALLQHQLGPSR